MQDNNTLEVSAVARTLAMVRFVWMLRSRRRPRSRPLQHHHHHLLHRAATQLQQIARIASVVVVIVGCWALGELSNTRMAPSVALDRADSCMASATMHVPGCDEEEARLGLIGRGGRHGGDSFVSNVCHPVPDPSPPHSGGQ